MPFSNFCHISVAVALLLFLNLTNQVTAATLERRQGGGQTDPMCGTVPQVITAEDCNIAILTLPFTDKRATLPTGGNYVESAWKSCKVAVSCATKTQTTSMALLTNLSSGGKGGGYNKLIEKCGPDGKTGIIYFDQACAVSMTRFAP
ncbi:hypothetical protein PCASD_12192 [Puccinia coronata f. sp. avenae]|uniref:Uncharacterized protein n=1 Tax=Puccinia coronata f. sp. avenae TaxID=200324 RepID=A0A2N5TD33_9BASI|nr:hypothetical protein PCASD_14728 [Puccinia coronata f. sp. avenae]PLW37675.1 hypothetical protein PCASD_12192 [Puccinia coronata f. sp. avenae]